ncbi:MAG: DUF1826 domain-containing protein [Candidatus Sericytochromatia bacterium]
MIVDLKNNILDNLDIHQDDVNISILKRDLDINIIDFINKIYPFQKKELDKDLKLKDLKKILEKQYKEYSYLNEKGYNNFIEDILTISYSFSELVKSEKISIYLSFLERTKCPLFHCDFNEIRLLCTYTGLGTEWVDNDNYNRDKLGCGDNSLIIKDFSKINRASNFDVLLIKGAKYKNNKYPLIHRSPEVYKNEFRFLFRLDKF